MLQSGFAAIALDYYSITADFFLEAPCSSLCYDGHCNFRVKVAEMLTDWGFTVVSVAAAIAD